MTPCEKAKKRIRELERLCAQLDDETVRDIREMKERINKLQLYARHLDTCELMPDGEVPLVVRATRPGEPFDPGRDGVCTCGLAALR